ncbi:PREDICTED: serine/threonine-protein phosphatase 4 regulatory subunit 2-like [Trachymyrmex cornetzi]|uniref:Serine/threonine-protein phosphatase 4 regulatory subunit 2 n=1 Tax=Trachymyrmex cornetzi TaxID=471704 RepID=A0A195D9T6_9HYME|nr:PREDICTED: serine/threonine-protein phosphatase 4 regulatory subunit 2-like [Trachymyrmex cornetzi]KYN09631.1 Serine/threonine-protein phosphatase 4 regulatory subunit 2 [Trachymyrmex cornetzi]
MENLEEVLQALDEFQKMRPSVIPQELEDYLCWVAKTGDPVYQWPLIKTLVREKLTRVMTDFYESCPTLELAPCPNVEHFNYDTMKSNLLERLESFANAPFTVQRICELLTAPRKEYNRVDKFMRAIEKNILVVSTREPGPITRRGETGDGMVNGSVEEDAASVTQQPPPPSSSQPSSQPSSQTTQPQPAQPTSQDVEMEYWEKDCSSTVTISVHTVENEPPLMHSGVIPASDSTLTKNLFAEETVRDKLEQVTSRTDISATNYITAVSDFSTISNLNLQPHGPVPEAIATAVPVVQSLPAVEAVSEDSMVPSTDIAVAIMNEDTNSQPNLDMENEEIETSTATASTTTSTTTAATTTTATATTTTTTATSTTSVSTAATTTVTVVATVIPLTTDTTRKLQAAFQAKRFESGDNKSVDKSNNEKTTDPSTLDSVEEEIEQPLKDEETTKSSPERIDPDEMSRDESRLTESLLQTDVEMKSDALADDTESVEESARDKPKEEESSILEDLDEENLRSTSSQTTNATALVESQSMEKDSTVTSNECVSAVIVSSTETLYKTEKSEIHSKEESETISSTECFARDQSISQKTESVEEPDKVLEAIPTTASSSSNTNGQEEQESDNDNLNIMEISNDKMVLVESMTSDPISSVEKSKEATSVIEKLDPVSPTVETIESSDNVSCRSPKDDKLTADQDDNLANSQGNKATAGITIKGNQSSVIESIACRKESEELMEVDDEESLSTFQQDEPMEQEAMEELPKIALTTAILLWRSLDTLFKTRPQIAAITATGGTIAKPSKAKDGDT